MFPLSLPPWASGRQRSFWTTVAYVHGHLLTCTWLCSVLWLCFNSLKHQQRWLQPSCGAKCHVHDAAILCGLPSLTRIVRPPQVDQLTPICLWKLSWGSGKVAASLTSKEEQKAAVNSCQGVGPLWTSCFTDPAWEARPRDPVLSGPPTFLEVLSLIQSSRKGWMPSPFHIALTLSLGKVLTSSPLECGGGRIPSILQGPSSWTKNQIEMRQANRKKLNLVLGIGEILTDMTVKWHEAYLSSGERQDLGMQRGGRQLAGRWEMFRKSRFPCSASKFLG